MTKKMSGLLLILIWYLTIDNVFAQAPENTVIAPFTVTYQGHLSDLAQQDFTGERDLTFRLYHDPIGGEAI